ncbi:glycoside hydrolase family 113 [Streptomyces sp. NPDC054961]
MKRSRLPLLAVLPVVVLSTVVASSAAGSQFLHWEDGSLMPVLGADEDASAERTAGAGVDGGTRDSRSSPHAASRTGRVDKPWKPGMPEWGVQIYWEDSARISDAEVKRRARQKAEYLVGLHANSVSLSFPYYTKGPASDELFAGPQTPAPARMAIVLRVFHEAGLRVTLRPLMDEKALKPPKTGWRGNIEPVDRSAWFAAYAKLLGPYAALAEKHRVASFVIGAELNSLESDPGWTGLIDALKKEYGGELTYDANWDNFISGPVKVPAASIGLDAYFPVKVPDDAPVEALADGWNKWLDKKSTGPMPEVVLAEAGIGAMDGAYPAPGDFSTKRAVNEDVQANWYQAVCKVVVDRTMEGVYWWSLNFDDDPYAAPAERISRLNFAGRPKTERAIRDCFGSAYAGPGGAR